MSFKLFWKKFNQKLLFWKKFNQKSFFLEKKTLEKRINKKGQAEISETLLVLLIVVFLIIAGVFVYYLFFYRSLGVLGSEKTDIENLILLYTFALSPEVKCENEDCVDVVKLFSFKELITDNKGYYFSRFGKRKIVVENIYPILGEDARKTECDLEKYQQSLFPENCAYLVVYDNLDENKGLISVSLPVSLYYANLNEYRIGILKVQINR